MENYNNGVYVTGRVLGDALSVSKGMQDENISQVEKAAAAGRQGGALKELKTAQFCLSDDQSNHVKITINANDDMGQVLEKVEKCFGVSASTFDHIVLIDEKNSQNGAPIINMAAFWEVYASKYSVMNNAKFMVVFGPKKRVEDASTFSGKILLSPECQSLSTPGASHVLSCPWNSSWEEISKAVCEIFQFPVCNIEYFLILDSEGDEMSSLLNTPEKFWKAASTLHRDGGDCIQVYLDDVTFKKVHSYVQRQRFLMSSDNFCIELDCDKSCRAELFMTSGATWTQISDEIVMTLGLDPLTKLKKLVLLDAEQCALSSEITTDSKFWKIYEVKYKKTHGCKFAVTVSQPERQQLFFDACSRSELATTLFSVIKQGVDINAVCEGGSISGGDATELRSGIQLAILNSNTAAARLLCAMDCLEVNRPDVYGMTPLHHACTTGNLDLILLLIEKGAIFKGHNTLGKTAVHAFAERGFIPCRNSNPKLSRILSSEGEGKVSLAVINAYDNSGATALITAAKRSDLSIVKGLVECGAIVNLRDAIGMSAFLYAVHAGSLVIARYLMDQGTNVSARNNAGEDALMMCAITGNLKVAEFLLGIQLDFDTRNHGGQGLQEVAVACGNVAIADWFTSNGSGKKSLSAKALNHLVETDMSLERRLRAEENSAFFSILKVHATVFDGPSPAAQSIRAVLAAETVGPVVTVKLSKKDAREQTSSMLPEKQTVFDFRKAAVEASSGKKESRHLDPISIDNNFSLSMDSDVPSPSNGDLQPQHSFSSSPTSSSSSVDYDFSDLDGAAIYNICNSGNKDKMEKMFESGCVNLNAVESDGSDFTALHGACEKGNLKVVQVLLASSCNPNPFSFDGETPLYLACSHGHVAIAKMLGAKGVDVAAKVRDTTVLHTAAANMHLDMVTWLVKQMKLPVDALNDAGFTALHETCRGNDSLMARLLVNLGAAVEACENNAPLHVACFMGHLDLCKWLVSKGANPNTMYRGRNCFFIACSGAQPSVAAWLDSIGTDIHSNDLNDGRSPLHAACAAEHKELCAWLIRKSDNYLRLRDHHDESAYCLALRTRDKELVEMFAAELQKGIGRTVYEEHVKEELIDMLAKTVAEKDVPVANFVLQHLLNMVPVDHVCTDECTPLHFAAAIGNVTVMNYLISKGAKIDARNREHKTPLHYAAINGSVEAATCLADAGVDLLAKDCDGRDAEMYAKHFKHSPFRKWFKTHPKVIKARAPSSSFFSMFSCVAESSKDDEISDDSASAEKELFEQYPTD
jgi:ankyrin repeat protein